MSTKDERDRLELLQGTLDLLILRTLRLGPAHALAIMVEQLRLMTAGAERPCGRAPPEEGP